MITEKEIMIIVMILILFTLLAILTSKLNEYSKETDYKYIIYMEYDEIIEMVNEYADKRGILIEVSELWEMIKELEKESFLIERESVEKYMEENF